MRKVLVTGCMGFVNGYVIPVLLDKGYSIIGIDDESKYGHVNRSFENNPNFEFVKGDAKNTDLLKELVSDCDHFIASAAHIGGITYFNQYSFDLLAENERILAAEFEAAIWAHKNRHLKKITAISSSMIYENATVFPTPEGHEEECSPPITCYGFQKLAVHYFCKGAHQQYGLPYSIAIPFNCVGTGEHRAKSDIIVTDGNIKLAMSHVVPDIIQKIAKGQYPVHLLGCAQQVRHFTYAQDLAIGIVKVMENMDVSLGQSYNISTPHGHTVEQLAQTIWNHIGPKDKEFKHICVPGYDYDVIKRVPDVSKAKKELGIECNTTLDEIIENIKDFYLTKEFLEV